MKWLKKVGATPLTAIARVIDSLEATTNDRTNAPSIHAVREAVNNNWLSIYPVGSVYMSVNNVNPSTIFGGTWEQIKDKFLLACGDTYNNGATGGEATHTLTSDEMPSHNHGYTTPTAVNGHALTVNEMPSHHHSINAFDISTTPYTYNFEITFGESASPKNYFNIYNYNASTNAGQTLDTGGGAAHSHSLTTGGATTQNTGGGNAHNNMPPYLAVNVWVRTA